MTVRREKVEGDFVADCILTDAMGEATFLRMAVDRQYFYERSGATKLCLQQSTASQEPAFFTGETRYKIFDSGFADSIISLD